MFDDDYGLTQRGVNVPSPWPDQVERNQINNGGQNLPGAGQLMYDKYIEESAAAIGCPQADFTEITPFTGSIGIHRPSHNYQYVKELMGYPRLDPDKNYGSGGAGDPNIDPNAYWRNDFYSGDSKHGWNDEAYVSNYVVRGPMFRNGDVRELPHLITYTAPLIGSNTRPKADSQVAIFADHEFAATVLGDWDPVMLPIMGYDKPASRYFPRRHFPGPVVAYTDGHAAVFQDETRRKTWNHDPGLYYSNQTHNYGNGWALFGHVFDAE